MSLNSPQYHVLVQQPGNSCIYNIGELQLNKNKMMNIINKSTSISQVKGVKKICDNKIKELTERINSEEFSEHDLAELKTYKNILRTITNKYATFIGPRGTTIRIIRRSQQTRRQLFPESNDPFDVPSAGDARRGGSGFTNYSKRHLITRIESKLKRMKKDKITKIIKSLKL